MNNRKFVIHAVGPTAVYGLDLLVEKSPNVLKYVICFTTRNSYKFYKKYENIIDFVFMDDYRKDHPMSMKYEIFPDHLDNEKDYIKNVCSFYRNLPNSRWWPFDTRRFIFPYLIENDILNFVIMNNNVRLCNDPDRVEKYFDNIPVGCMYGPFHGEDQRFMELKLNMWESLQPEFPEIELKSNFLRTCDGWLRGFHFRNKEDAQLYYRIWNSSMDKILDSDELVVQSSNNGFLLHTEWVSSHIDQFFEQQRGYVFADCYRYFEVEGRRTLAYASRPEDKIHFGPYECWSRFNLDYSNTDSIADFINNNIKQLTDYYNNTWPFFEIRDSHVYTYID